MSKTVSLKVIAISIVVTKLVALAPSLLAPCFFLLVSSHAVETTDSTARNEDEQFGDNTFTDVLNDIVIDHSVLEKKSALLRQTRQELDDRLKSADSLIHAVKTDLVGLRSFTGEDRDNDSQSLETFYDLMEQSAEKLTELTRRTSNLMRQVSEYNRLALLGKIKHESEIGQPDMGLMQRLNNSLTHELQRRDRYHYQMSQKARIRAAKITNMKLAKEAEKASFITLHELEALLNNDAVISGSEVLLQTNLSEYLNGAMSLLSASEEETIKDHFVEKKLRHEDIKERAKHKVKSNQCFGVTQAAKTVAHVLVEHYHDGVNMTDHSSFENGASVVYDLTSIAFKPPPRNGDHINSEGLSTIDAEVEAAHYQQRSLLQLATHNGKIPIAQQVSDIIQTLDFYKWYTSYKFENLRPYLPDDWERALDNLFNYQWDEFTPRGAVDALIPDYVYHSLGLSNINGFGSLFGRTVSPEVAITSGRSKSGGKFGEAAGSMKPLGSCYPLSMRPEDDPALAFMSHADGTAPIALGPKLTVRLPYPLRVNAITLEHRSFPTPPNLDGLEIGRSAPRWVRVLGYPPCPKSTRSSADINVDQCGERGFDISNPVDLGLFEYNQRQASERDENGDGVDTMDVYRRRSIQTFSVKGGDWKPPSFYKNNQPDYSSTASASDPSFEKEEGDASQCSMEKMSCGAPSLNENTNSDPISTGSGQCEFSSDEFPSCSIESLSSQSKSDSRHVIEAVSFIIEENWGNDDYTCLYRVRVHGDPLTIESN